MSGDGENGGDSVLNLRRKNNYNRAPVTQILKGNEKQFELARNSSYGVNFSEINKVKGREI